jgi:predicted nucleic acid-binding protein
MIFFDASAIVKAYVAEVGSAEVRSTIAGLQGSLYLTPHVVLEVLSAFAKKLRANRVNRRAYRTARTTFLSELGSLNLLEVGETVFAAANDLIDQHRRVSAGALDVLHVSSALHLQTLWPQESVIVASSDRAFLSLVRAAGLPTFDPETESFGQLQARLG